MPVRYLALLYSIPDTSHLSTYYPEPQFIADVRSYYGQSFLALYYDKLAPLRKEELYVATYSVFFSVPDVPQFLLIFRYIYSNHLLMRLHNLVTAPRFLQ